jgi:hypothetical protein
MLKNRFSYAQAMVGKKDNRQSSHIVGRRNKDENVSNRREFYVHWEKSNEDSFHRSFFVKEYVHWGR